MKINLKRKESKAKFLAVKLIYKYKFYMVL